MKPMYKYLSVVLGLLLVVSIEANGGSCPSGSCGKECPTSCLKDCPSKCDCPNDCDKSCEDRDKDAVYCKSQFRPRSQGVAGYRHWANADRFIHEMNEDEVDPWTWDATFEYNASFDDDALGKYFSFRRGSESFVVGPNGADCTDIRNIDLGLHPDFESTVKFDPEIKNFIWEPSIYFSLDKYKEGMWFMAKAPIVWTEWELDCTECITNTGGDVIPVNCFDLPEVTEFPKTAREAFRGNTGYGQNKSGLEKCRFLCCEDHQTSLADITGWLGWTPVNTDDGHFSVYARGVIPAGNNPQGDHIFQARVGDSMWQLGVGAHGNWKFLEDNNHTFRLYGDFNVTHMFSKKVCRCFDLKKNGCGSRYLLLKEFCVGPAAHGLTYNSKLVNFSDVFSVRLRSKFDYQLEATAGLNWEYKGWNLDGGYNLWVRNKENFGCTHVSLCSCNRNLDNKAYGIKGDTKVDNNMVQPCATMSESGEITEGAVLGSNVITDRNVFDMLDYDRGRIPRGTSHTIFLNAQYTYSKPDYDYFLNWGGKVEFANHRKATDQWGVFGKWGLHYNA